MGLFDQLKQAFKIKSAEHYLRGFQPTNLAFKQKFSELEADFKQVDQQFLERVLVILLESDIGYPTADKIIQQLKAKTRLKLKLSFSAVIEQLFTIMHDLYGEPAQPLVYNPVGPTVILLVGVNGSGKTTSCAKLIKYFQDQAKSVAVVAADTFRAGAVEQLERWATRLDVACIKGKAQGDPSAVLVDGCRYAQAENIDVLLCDTAGRLQNKRELMQELAKMHRVISREIPGAPQAVWLVIDATTGQNGLSQAEVFLEAAKVTGIILTKLDGTAKGGIILGIKDQYQIPVEFVGLGEQLTDLARFELDSYLYSVAEGIYDVKED